ncbi:MAG TPA: diiron oxygenase [Casimicrobiaceae bacterium]|nr:diiron oxygenase [Casimicrobiaceae bacterium]
MHLTAHTRVPYEDPLFQIDWDAVDRQCWWLPPDALSLAGVPQFEALPLAERQRLSHCEYLHLLQTGLWLEELFVERLALLAWRAGDADARAAYLREIREEAGHSLMFVELIRRSGIAVAPRQSAGVRAGHALGRWIPPGSALFWAMVVIGEELPNRLNRQLQRGVEDVTLSAVVFQIARIHSHDEALHAAFARRQCAEATQRLAPWRRALLSRVLAVAFGAFVRHVHYPPPSVYESAGLRPGGRWRTTALRNPVRQALARQTATPTLEFLRRIGWKLP